MLLENKMQTTDNQKQSLTLAFVGSIVPDANEFHTLAFSRAGNMFQENILIELENNGLKPSIVLSIRPVPSFPKNQKIWINEEKVLLKKNIEIVLLPFINVTPIKQIWLGFATITALLKWKKDTKNFKQHLIYTYNLTIPPGLFTFIAARLIGAKIIVSLNDINIPGQTVSNNIYNNLDYWVQKKLIPLYDGHIVVTDNIIKDFTPDKNYLRIEGGVSQYMFDKTAEGAKKRKKENEPQNIVFAGNLSVENGIAILLEAFTLLSGDYQLHIAGKGAFENDVILAAQSDSRIIYHGFCSLDDILDLYNSADILINFRLTKAMNTKYFFPSKLMEYLASGTPVITTCAAHIEEEYKDFAYLLKDETPESLADMIKNIASIDPAIRQEKGRKAREYMQTNKTWEAQGKKIVNYILDKSKIHD